MEWKNAQIFRKVRHSFMGFCVCVCVCVCVCDLEEITLKHIQNLRTLVEMLLFIIKY